MIRVTRGPYYLCAAVYSGLAAFVYFIQNQIVTGTASDLYLALFVASCILCLASVLYFFTGMSGGDEEADIDVAGLPFGKLYWYLGMLALVVLRIIGGYQTNHSSTGIASIWGAVWMVASIGIGLFTYANYRSYIVAHPAKAPLR